jgi:Right handed beta helix region/FlgD Ig-like domain
VTTRSSIPTFFIGHWLEISRAGMLLGRWQVGGISLGTLTFQGNGTWGAPTVQPGDSFQGVYQFDHVIRLGNAQVVSVDPIVAPGYSRPSGSLDIGAGQAVPVPVGSNIAVSVTATDSIALSRIVLRATGAVTSASQTLNVSGTSTSASFQVGILPTATSADTVTFWAEIYNSSGTLYTTQSRTVSLLGTGAFGNVASSTTWTRALSPYILSGTVTVNAGVTLTIQDGVTVLFNSAAQLSILGTLTAIGTAATPITFTSSAVNPAMGLWKNIIFQAGSSAFSQISYATIDYGGDVNNGTVLSGGNGEVIVAGGSPTFDHLTVNASSRLGFDLVGGAAMIRNSTVTGNNWSGISVWNATATLTDSSFSGNAQDGIQVWNSSSASLNNVALSSNGGYAIQMHSSAQLSTISGVTASSNGSGNVIGLNPGTTPISGAWHAGLPYRVLGSSPVVSVPAAGALTIDPGVTVQFPAGGQLSVNGRLSAIGTSASPIVLTSSSPSPTRGSWGDVFFQSGSSTLSQMSYVNVMWGGNRGTDSGAVVIVGGNPTFDHVMVSNSSTHGFNMGGTPSTSFATIKNCTSTSNGWYGLSVWTATATVTDSTFANNVDRGLGVFNTSSASLTNVSSTNNGTYAIQLDPSAQIASMSGVTASGNASGDVIAMNAGTTPTASAWHAGLPYRLLGTSAVISVPANGVLTVDPGVTVQFPASGQLSVSGKLLAVGTAANPILFTSSSATPTKGSWGDVYFQPGSSTASLMSYATVAYGGLRGSDNGAIVVSGGTPTFDTVTVASSGFNGFNIVGGTATIQNSTVTGSTYTGIGLLGSGANAVISNSTITGNGDRGVNALSSSSASLSNLTVTNNAGYAIGIDANSRYTSLSGITAIGNGSGTKDVAAIEPGTITIASQTLHAGGISWQLSTANSTLIVSASSTLNVDPGVTLRFPSGSQLNVAGKLMAVGTQASPIFFTTSSTTPVPGSWRSIFFPSGAVAGSQIAYATMSYGGATDGGNVVVIGGSPTFDHLTSSSSATNGFDIRTGLTTIRDSVASSNGTTGITVNGSSATVAITNTTLTGNGDRGVNVLNSGKPTIANCSFSGNAFGVAVDNSANVVPASLNFWNSAAGPSGTGPGSGQSVVAGITYEPWLVAAPNTVYEITAANSPAPFNPTTGGSATWNVTATSSGAWTLTVTDGTGATIRTITGTGASTSLSWDGKDQSGIVQPVGTYRYTIAVTSDGGVAATQATGRVTISSTGVRREAEDSSKTDGSGAGAGSGHATENGSIDLSKLTISVGVIPNSYRIALTPEAVGSDVVSVDVTDGLSSITQKWDSKRGASILWPGEPGQALTVRAVSAAGQGLASTALAPLPQGGWSATEYAPAPGDRVRLWSRSTSLTAVGDRSISVFAPNAETVAVSTFGTGLPTDLAASARRVIVAWPSEILVLSPTAEQPSSSRVPLENGDRVLGIAADGEEIRAAIARRGSLHLLSIDAQGAMPSLTRDLDIGDIANGVMCDVFARPGRTDVVVRSESTMRVLSVADDDASSLTSLVVSGVHHARATQSGLMLIGEHDVVLLSRDGNELRETNRVTMREEVLDAASSGERVAIAVEGTIVIYGVTGKETPAEICRVAGSSQRSLALDETGLTTFSEGFASPVAVNVDAPCSVPGDDGFRPVMNGRGERIE